MLSIEDLGIFLYVCSTVYFLSNTSVMGAYVYLQRQVARQEVINARYLISILIFLVLSSLIAVKVLPSQTTSLKPYFVLIIVCNSIITLINAIGNGAGHYDNRYKILLISSIYMVLLIIYMLYVKTNYNLNFIFYGWIVNTFIAAVYAGLMLFSIRLKFNLSKISNIGFSTIILNLVLIYSVSMPYDFAKFYDRYLLSHYFSSGLLGLYTFNFSIIMAAFSFLVMPVISICLSALSKAQNDINVQAKIMLRYLMYILCVFVVIFIGYVPFTKYWLTLLGLNKYIGTTSTFIFVLIYMFLYSIAIPFIITISISNGHMIKIKYCLTSLLVFIIPLIFIKINHNFNIFLYGFLVAYFLHSMMAILFNYNSLRGLFYCMVGELMQILRSGPTGIRSLLTISKIGM